MKSAMEMLSLLNYETIERSDAEAAQSEVCNEAFDKLAKTFSEKQYKLYFAYEDEEAELKCILTGEAFQRGFWVAVKLLTYGLSGQDK